MNIYSRKQKWKLILLITALIIAFASFWFTNNLTNKLAEEERKKVELWAMGMRKITQQQNLEGDYRLSLKVIESNETVPMIWADSQDSVLSSRNVKKKYKENGKMQELIQEMKKENKPIEINLPSGETQYIYYKDSTLLTQLFYFPIIQLGVVGLFLLISYYAFSSSRKAEQNQVWVGMSKETAHQLGTPTSSLMANLELLKLKLDDETIIKEIEKDISRLNKITERFSKIGSMPSIKNENIVPVLLNTLNYLRSRSSKKIHFTTNFNEQDLVYAPINLSLFEWVVENLVKNAMDSMEGRGTIYIHLTTKEQQVILDVIDEGRGIPKVKQKTIFRPGYTTKKRGWGLGLSLSKRIIEYYHNGKIFVQESEQNKGATMRILLKEPKSIKNK
jgi:anti-sigma regulatory factor (Ser/Thr protein kinase)